MSNIQGLKYPPRSLGCFDTRSRKVFHNSSLSERIYNKTKNFHDVLNFTAIL